MIDAEALVFDYPTGRVLHGVGFVVRAGAVLALVGPEGAGKSTLLRCLAALDGPTRGHISVAGLDTQDDPRGVHGLVGYLPEAAGLYDALTVRQSLTYAARTRGVTAAGTEAAVAFTSARVGLAQALDELAGELAPGPRQRLALGQALVHRPRVLLLDAPMAALEASARAVLVSLIPPLAAVGTTVVISARFLSELGDICTEVLMLEAGRVVGGGVIRL
ncbi:MAG: ABC transporter ATP-binding protein [Caulobacteraceae bacterium]